MCVFARVSKKDNIVNQNPSAVITYAKLYNLCLCTLCLNHIIKSIFHNVWNRLNSNPGVLTSCWDFEWWIEFEFMKIWSNIDKI